MNQHILGQDINLEINQPIFYSICMIKIEDVHIRASYNKIDSILPIIIKKGTGVEFFISAYFLDRQPLEKLKLLENYTKKGKSISWHAPFVDLSPGGLDEKFRDLTVERLKQAIELAAPFSPKVVVVHSGYDRNIFNGNADLWLLNSIKTWRKILNLFPTIHFAVENVFEHSPYFLISLIEGIGSDRFGHCFDTGHFNLFSRVSLDEWIDKMGHYIKEIHLHDNIGREDQHLGIGQGEFNFQALFENLSKKNLNPLLTIEAHTTDGIEKSLRFLKKFNL